MTRITQIFANFYIADN